MLHYLMIIQTETGFLLFNKQFSSIFNDLSSDLMSNMMVALNEFSRMMKIGDLSTFISHDFRIAISVTKDISVVLIIDQDDNEEIWKNAALKISEEFHAMYADLTGTVIDINQFSSFNNKLDILLPKFTWKIAIDSKLDIESVNLILLFDLENMLYYRFSNNFKSRDEELIEKTLKVTNKQTPEVKVTEDENLLYIAKENNIGGVLVLNERAAEKSLERLQKTFVFTIKNFHTRFSMNQSLKKAGIAIFGEDVINNFVILDGKSILEILRDIPNAFDQIENIRRLMLRGLLVIMSD